MPIRIIRKILPIAILLLLISVCVVTAEDGNNVGFDPFSSESSTLAKNDKSASGPGPIIPQVEFNNDDISMAFQIISDSTGWSVFPTADVSKAKISLWAKSITAKELLDTVVTMAGYIYYRQGDIITVMTYDEYMRYHGLAKRVFKLKYTAAVSVDAVIKPFLTNLGRSVVHRETNAIVLYETDANLEFIAAVIEKLDTPSEDMVLEVVDLKYADSELLAEKLQQLFVNEKLRTQDIKSDRQISETDGSKKKITEAKNDAEMDGSQKTITEAKIDAEMDDSKKKITEAKIDAVSESISPQSQVYIQAIGRTNQLIIRALRTDIEMLKQLISKLDTYIEPVTRNYQLTYVDASEIFSGLEKILNLNVTNTSQRDRSQKIQGLSLIEKTNSILLTGPPSTQRVMTTIIESIDQPSTYETGMVKVYKVENADVEEVAKIVSDLLETNSAAKDAISSKAKFSQKTATDSRVSTSAGLAKTDSQVSTSAGLAKSEEFVPQIEARVSVSKSTNSIIVQATTRQHRELEKLIKELDTRRKQVLIEATIVELTNTDNLSLGVELSHALDDVIAFSSFGLSKNLDPTAGTRDITVSPGGTAAVLRPDKVQAIFQALKQDGKVRIASAPRILVNDNAVGFINSIAEEPTMQTNQGQTTTVTSFGGFVEAGTQFAITPHISENDYLRVEYQITLNSFGTKPTDPSIPPPRNTSSIQSEATVPDGYTIVVGGLQTTDESKNVDKVPLLGDIPILEWAFKNTKIEKQYKTTYLFITPYIMENQDFADLKKISKETLQKIEPNEGQEKHSDKSDGVVD